MNISIKKSLVTLMIIFSGLAMFSDANAIKVTVTQDLRAIGLECTELPKENGQTKTKGYECEIGTGFSAVSGIFQKLLKYFVFLAGLCAVLFIVFNGIMYSMAGIDEHMKADVKGRIWSMLGGIIVLLLSGVILQVIAPWVYR